MTSIPKITVTIIAFNEEQKIGRAVKSAHWADEIIVVDSKSTDRTREIAESLGARVVVHPWQGYGRQKNFAHELASHEWVLNIDADEWISPALATEIRSTLRNFASSSAGSPAGFDLPRRTYYLGRWIRHGGWYPNRLVRLAQKTHSRWSEPQVHEALEVQGPIGSLSEPLDHDAFSSIADQIETNLRFARLGARDLQNKGQTPSILKLLVKPVGKWLETYVFKLGFLDGLRGFIISTNAAHSMFMKYCFLFEARLLREKKSPEKGI